MSEPLRIKVPVKKPRNPLVAPSHRRKAGPHKDRRDKRRKPDVREDHTHDASA